MQVCVPWGHTELAGGCQAPLHVPSITACLPCRLEVEGAPQRDWNSFSHPGARCLVLSVSFAAQGRWWFKDLCGLRWAVAAHGGGRGGWKRDCQGGEDVWGCPFYPPPSPWSMRSPGRRGATLPPSLQCLCVPLSAICRRRVAIKLEFCTFGKRVWNIYRVQNPTIAVLI